MDPADVQLRNATYAAFVERGRAPEADEISSGRKSTWPGGTAQRRPG